MQIAASFPIQSGPFTSALRALKSAWIKGPAPCWTEYLRETRS
nr:hypothetical protein [uncultured Celeribacter sp.]